MNYFYCEKSEQPCVPATIHSYDSPRHKLGSFEIESFSPDYLEVKRQPPEKKAEQFRFYTDRKKCDTYCMNRGKATSARQVFTEPLLAKNIGEFLGILQPVPAPLKIPVASMLKYRIVAPLPGAREKQKKRPSTHVYSVQQCPEILLDSEKKDQKGKYLYRQGDLVMCAAAMPQRLEHILQDFLLQHIDVHPAREGALWVNCCITTFVIIGICQ